jgi:hypothetical protein
MLRFVRASDDAILDRCLRGAELSWGPPLKGPPGLGWGIGLLTRRFVHEAKRSWRAARL